jgi:hypothetical protein
MAISPKQAMVPDYSGRADELEKSIDKMLRESYSSGRSDVRSNGVVVAVKGEHMGVIKILRHRYKQVGWNVTYEVAWFGELLRFTPPI